MAATSRSRSGPGKPNSAVGSSSIAPSYARAVSDHDYVIVGAGSAGCVLAARLSEDPAVRVLLLEAGPRDRKLEIRIPAAFSKLYDSDVDWGFRTAAQAALGGREVLFPRGRVVG